MTAYPGETPAYSAAVSHESINLRFLLTQIFRPTAQRVFDQNITVGFIHMGKCQPQTESFAILRIEQLLTANHLGDCTNI